MRQVRLRHRPHQRKGSGYFGCYNAKRKLRDNKLRVARTRAERAIVSALEEAERRDLALEIQALEFQKRKRFEAPPRKWIEHRMASPV